MYPHFYRNVVAVGGNAKSDVDNWPLLIFINLTTQTHCGLILCFLSFKNPARKSSNESVDSRERGDVIGTVEETMATQMGVATVVEPRPAVRIVEIDVGINDDCCRTCRAWSVPWSLGTFESNNVCDVGTLLKTWVFFTSSSLSIPLIFFQF